MQLLVTFFFTVDFMHRTLRSVGFVLCRGYPNPCHRTNFAPDFRTNETLLFIFTNKLPL